MGVSRHNATFHAKQFFSGDERLLRSKGGYRNVTIGVDESAAEALFVKQVSSYAVACHQENGSEGDRLPMSSGNATVFSPEQTKSVGWTKSIEEQLRHQFAKGSVNATPDELFRSVAAALRPQIIDRLLESTARFHSARAKSVYYLSMEFLLGRSLLNNLQNLGLYGVVGDALSELGLRLSDVLEVEPDAALGNGGLGRLAACFLDSLASLHMPGYGYGINYEFGLFRQEIEDGFQKERPDYWASAQSPWLIEHQDQAVVIPIYGRVEHEKDRAGNYNPMWMDWKVLIGVPHDFPIVGQDGRTVNTLRLFSARASDEFDIRIFNKGDYIRAVEQKIQSETVSKVLYPSDAFDAGRYLRFTQEYFLVACAVRDIFRRFLSQYSNPRDFANQIAIQMNDTHPSLAVAELMRTLIDEHEMEWDESWEITQAACGYTNHTLMPEALERWPVDMFQRVLPRHLQIVYEINHRFLKQVAGRWPGDEKRQQRMSVIEEGSPQMVRMANLAIIGSHAVNGVAELHSNLVRTDLVPDFNEFYPGRFSNKTNGVTPRRWLMHANPALSAWITDLIGDHWREDFYRLRDLEQFAEDPTAQDNFQTVKQDNKRQLARTILDCTGVRVDTAAMFDVQVKRIHEYKRQLLHALAIIDEYFRIVEDGQRLGAPRVHVFAGKAAPGYYMAKLIIKLINNIATAVNHDPRVGNQLKVIFLPDYKVSLAEIIIPAADLSEQVSTAGMEASGTSNMKFALNGALTVGTLDGANVEMLQEVGAENIFIFGLRTEEVRQLRSEGYQPSAWYQRSAAIRRVVDSLTSGVFSTGEEGIFDPIRSALLDRGDQYLHLADIESYFSTQAVISNTFTNPSEWNAKAILNVARMSKFSSDRTIREYAKDIWNIRSVYPAITSGR
jgi:starch phosphorylase